MSAYEVTGRRGYMEDGEVVTESVEVTVADKETGLFASASGPSEPVAFAAAQAALAERVEKWHKLEEWRDWRNAGGNLSFAEWMLLNG